MIALNINGRKLASNWQQNGYWLVINPAFMDKCLFVDFSYLTYKFCCEINSCVTCKDLLPIKRWPRKLGPAILPIDYWPWQLDQPCSPIEHRSQNLVMVSHTQPLNIVKTFKGYGTAWSQGNLTPLCIDFICLNKLLFSFAR